MRVKISDMMDHFPAATVEIKELDLVSADRIKSVTLTKLHSSCDTRPARRLSAVWVAVAVLAAMCFLAACAAVAVTVDFTGFTFLTDMNEAEKKAWLVAASSARAKYYDEDGNHYYLDENGEVLMMLTAKEAAEYERTVAEAREQEVMKSVTLVDASTIKPYVPYGINQVASSADGSFADFALASGHMILLYPNGQEGYELQKGDQVTVSCAADESCILKFSWFLDGVFAGSEDNRCASHTFVFTAPEDGLYCFGLTYYSAGAGLFKECEISVRKEESSWGL